MTACQETRASASKQTAAWLPLHSQITPSKSQITAKITSSFSLNCPSAPGLFPNKGEFGQKWLPDTSIFPTLRTFDPLAGDPVRREDLEPDKADTATVVTEENSEASSWRDLSPEGPAPLTEEELDLRLIRTKGGVDAALEYAKAWSRYAKELLAWTDKRANYGEASFCPAPDGSRTQTPAACRPLSLLLLELEFAKSIMKLAEAGKVSILQQVGTSPLQPDPPLPRSSTPPPIRSVPELAPHSAPEPNATPVHLHLVSGA